MKEVRTAIFVKGKEKSVATLWQLADKSKWKDVGEYIAHNLQSNPDWELRIVAQKVICL